MLLRNEEIVAHSTTVSILACNIQDHIYNRTYKQTKKHAGGTYIQIYSYTHTHTHLRTLSNNNITSKPMVKQEEA